jgi:hypothetical protein
VSPWFLLHSGLQNLNVAADCVRTVDEIKDRVDTTEVSTSQTFDLCYGVDVDAALIRHSRVLRLKDLVNERHGD